jgi:malonate transporter and related proteins
MLTTFLTILPVFMVITAGYAAGRLRVLPDGSGDALSSFVVWVALPCLMAEVAATTDWTKTWNTGFVVASVTGSLCVLLAGMAIGQLRGVAFADRVVDGLNTSYSNTAYAGLPLLMLALGPESTPLVILAATLTLMLLFMVAVILIEFGQNHQDGMAKAFRKALGGIIRNPVLIGPLAGFAWWMTGWSLAPPIARTLHMLGSVASPAALFSIGLFLSAVSLTRTIRHPAVLGLSATKLIVHPAITAVIAWALHLDHFTAIVVIAIAALPTGTGPFMISTFYGRDSRVATGTIMLTTLLSALTLALILSYWPR